MTTDISSLNEYIRTRSAAAFSSLASQHTDWIYSAALRMVHDPHTAEDVTQAVFLLLAEHPEKASDKSLSGWLFKVTRYCAANALRARSRRAKHERQAAAMITELLQESDDTVWSDIAPLLENAVARLRSAERDIVLQRFYQNKSLADIGHALNISEDAARKRVAAVVEKLRTLLKTRGITTASAGLALLLTQRATHAAPAALKAIINTMPTAASASHSAILIANGAKHTMLISKIKLVAALSSAAILLGVGGWLSLNTSAADAPVPAAPSTAVATAASASASVDLSSPMAALISFFTATKNGDNATAHRCLVTLPKHEPTLIETAIEVDLANNRLFNEADKAFGPKAASLHNGTITLESVGQLFNTMGQTKVGLSGDTAEISAVIPPTVLNMVPAEMRFVVTSWSNAPVRFKKESDGWKLDLNHSMRVVMRTGSTPEKAEKTQIEILKTEAEDADSVATSIRDGDIPTASLARNVMNSNGATMFAAQKIHGVSWMVVPVGNP